MLKDRVEANYNNDNDKRTGIIVGISVGYFKELIDVYLGDGVSSAYVDRELSLISRRQARRGS